MRSLILRTLIGFATVGCALPAHAQSFQLQPTQLVGIELVGPGSPEFNTLVAKLVPDAGTRASLRPALEFSFIVRNAGVRPIQWITVRFDYTSRATLKPVAGTISQAYDGLPKGAFDLFLPSGAVSKLYGARPVQGSLLHVSEFQSSPVVKASVDSIIYSDGEFAGPDRASRFPRLSRESQEFNELLQELRGMKGQPVEALRTRLEQVSKEPRRKMEPLSPRTRTARMLLGVLDYWGLDQMQRALSDRASNPPTPAVRKQ